MPDPWSHFRGMFETQNIELRDNIVNSIKDVLEKDKMEEREYLETVISAFNVILMDFRKILEKNDAEDEP